MENSLQSARLKLARAKKHKVDLENAIKIFYNNTPLNLYRSPHPEKTGQDVLIVKIENEIPDDIILIVGDLVHNIRASLDHLACRLAEKNNHNSSGVSFPFDQDLEAFQRNGMPKIKKLTKEAQKKIENLMPYAGGHDLLYALSKMDNTDKHKELLTTQVPFRSLEGNFYCDHEFQMTTTTPEICLSKGIHLFTVPSQAKFEQGLAMEYTISFNQIDCIARRPVMDVINDQIVCVEQIIDDFENEFFK